MLLGHDRFYVLLVEQEDLKDAQNFSVWITKTEEKIQMSQDG